MEANQSIVDFNQQQIDINSSFIMAAIFNHQKQPQILMLKQSKIIRKQCQN